MPPTPSSVQEAYEAASHEPEPEEQPRRNSSSALTEDELKYLFSGAPHFLLERGARAQWHPHAIFPWDDSNSIQNLRDRRPLQHPIYALSTLHAHLPPVVEQSGLLPYQSELSETLKSKRPMFDLGVFEVPNMLSSKAKESGCVGFCYFLELPVSHARKNGQTTAYRPAFEKDLLRALEPGPQNEPYSDCRPGVTLDRLNLIKAGPEAWRRLGIRDCSVKSIALRIQLLCDLRTKLVDQSAPLSLFDMESIPALYNQLFTSFLYPPPRKRRPKFGSETLNLRAQIDVLIRVLSVKGAWIDFSVVEWRLRLGQVLWETTPHQDGDCIDEPTDESHSGADDERKWLLLQILLSAELLLRIDAAVKVGIVGSAHGDLDITPHDVHQINCLRTDKLDWDLICCRWALDNVVFHYHLNTEEGNASSASEGPQRSVSERIRDRLSMPKRKRKPAAESAWDCVVLPRFPWRQLEGLLYFARGIQWPEFETLRARMESNLIAAMLRPTNVSSVFLSPVTTTPLPKHHKRLEKLEMYRKSRTSRLVQLQTPPPSSETDADAPPNIGGWMSRTLLSGFILPGETLTHLSIAALLENDPDAIAALGPIANVYGGFVYKGKSWWSTAAIVGRILSCLQGSVMCAGWIMSPVVPLDTVGMPFSDCWFEIETRDDPKMLDIPRIYQSSRVFLDSSPLGVEGEMVPQAFSLPLDDPNVAYLQQTEVTFEKLTLTGTGGGSDASTALFPRQASATATFTVAGPHSLSSFATFPLIYDIQFISSYTCLPPIGRAKRFRSAPATEKSRQYYHALFENKLKEDLSQTDLLALRKRIYRRPRLPGHPLHTASYPYSYIPLPSLPTMAALPPSPGTDFRKDPWPYRKKNQRKHTFILDARGSKDKEAFARAWCAAVGTNAVVGRVGRTCLACCIREARAVDVAVVIRVGSPEL